MSKAQLDETESLDRYFAGQALYGDDFDGARIAAWYEDEREGYADLGARNAQTYRYAAHELNRRHVFRHLPPRRFANVLGVGSAYGDEFVPIADRIDALTIVDPSAAFARPTVHGIPARYVKPEPSGNLPFDSATFDLITCFGVLHHIPNVSKSVNEMARVLRPGGRLALREPIVSMGDWRTPRPGLTRRERGIPLHILRSIVSAAGLTVRHQSVCTFPLTVAVYARLRRDLFNSPLGTRLDDWLSRAFRWNGHYHATSAWQRIRPAVGVLILEKPQP
ncbi:MAG: class I SAM-dependent methyltransferase [Lautropia sp.]